MADYSTSDQAATFTTANEILGVGKIPIQIGNEKECVTKDKCLSPGNAKPEPLKKYASGFECPAERYLEPQNDYRVTVYGKAMILDEYNQLPSDCLLRSPTFVPFTCLLTTYNHDYLVDKFRNNSSIKVFTINN